MRKRTLNSIHSLREEKEVLEEEVRQLRAAIQLYTEIARRLSAGNDAGRSRDTARPLHLAVAA